MSTHYGPTPGSGISYTSANPASPYVVTGSGTVTGINITATPYINPYQQLYGSSGVVGPFTTTANPLDGLLRGGARKLNPLQLGQLLREHQFIPFENEDLCLFCYALDIYRTQMEHAFVIREE